MKKSIVEYIDSKRDEIINEWIMCIREKSEDYVLRVVSEQIFVMTSREFLELIEINFQGSTDNFQIKLEDFAEKVVRLGWQLSFVTDGLKQYARIIFEGMQREGIINQENQLSYVYEFDLWLTPVTNQIVNVYSTAWERTVSLQKIALQELSAPLIPVFDGISIMPLVGTVDTERAKQIMENLLNGVVKYGSEVVLIDITGVPVIDTMVAHHIIQAAEAVRLVGAKCMLVGIRPEIAQTIVSLGINLNQLTTKNTLKKGIETALELLNKKIVQVGGED